MSFRVSLPETVNAVPATADVGPLIVSVLATDAAPTETEIILLVDGFIVVVLPPPVNFKLVRYVHTGLM